MPMSASISLLRRVLCLTIAAAAWLAGTFVGAPAVAAPRSADYIVAVVDQELVTNAEVQQRMATVKREAQQSGAKLPPDADLARQVLDTLIDERAQLSSARDTGVRVEDPEVERAVAAVAAQNRISVAELRDRLKQDGIEFSRFRKNLREQILLERVREREVKNRIKVSDSEIDAFVASRAAGAAPSEYNIAQILVALPEGASDAEVADKRAQAQRALDRARAGEDFAKLVAELSNGAKDNGGALGMRSADRLPDLFVQAVRELRAGALVAEPLRSGAGFHVLKLLDRKDGGVLITQTRARHILLKPSPALSQAQATAKLGEFKQQIEAGQANFAQLARANSEDGSAAQGGELGWASPGQFVPEFEEAMKPLAPGQVSPPVVSRFGVHLIQVLERRNVPVDRKQQREIARNVLREQKFESAYLDWSREVRARAYVELREPPQ